MTNYDKVKECYECSGYKGCDLYTPANTTLCGWKETIRSDMAKLKGEEEGYLTFPILEKVIEDEIQQKMD